MANKKKDFSQVNTAPVYSSIADSIAEAETQQAEEAQYTQDELREIREAGKTQGRKGAKMVRINMAFAPDVHEYICIMSRVRGQSITNFCNEVFRHNKEQNLELFIRAKRFLDDFEKGT